jgi:hypothetical protein
MAMTQQIFGFFASLVLFSAVVCGLHYVIDRFLGDAHSLHFEIWQIYLFLALITWAGYLFILFIHRRDPTKTGFTFIGVGFLKMLASVAFLYPLIAAAPDTIMTDVLTFFVPYFLFLAFELYFVTRLLSKK